MQPAVNNQAGEPVERTLWGELQAPEDESEEEEEESEEEEEEDEDDMKGLETPGGLVTPGGMQSAVPSEYPVEEVGGSFDIRQEKRGTETEEYTGPRSAYTVIPERQTRVEGFFGGDRAYDVSAANRRPDIPVLGQEDRGKRKKAGDVDVAVDPEADPEELRRRYEAARREEGVAGVKGSSKWGGEEDLSELIESEHRKRQKRDEERRSRR
ncbi:MAG: hypothetical protein H9W83_01255 [Leuconostoc sp.]|nr:hypothetical protein [Leuconostoc sp.]